MILAISDVHFALDALRRVVEMGQPVLILGDLVNLTDYRTGEGAVADVLGLEFARASAAARAVGDYQGMRDLWSGQAAGRFDEVRSRIGAAIDAQYREVATALEGGTGFVIHGNVDRPGSLRASLPDGFRYVHGEAVEIEGIRFGFVGGGAPTPLEAEGEVTDDEMRRLLEQIGPVDILCTHVPAAVGSLRTDVITGKAERGSEPILDYLLREKPRLHLFGDVHQPQATTWRLGPTRCRNVGYFRATGRAVHVDPTWTE
ncbi:MAG: metallophosphoesterase [Actinomycetota bacterium]|nr:metallophosphoesterase [Actinomycetota bacterium]